MDENASLRAELARLRAAQEAEVGRLRRNIQLKDQLLDDCEREIGLLRSHYQQLLQNVPPAVLPAVAPAASPAARPPAATSSKETQTQSSAVDLSMIPLSILARGGGGREREKMSHGLMRKAVW